MSKILVILTGGTIGSCVEENVISAKAERSAEIVKRYQASYGMAEDFTVVQPLNELSENLHPSNWESIIKEMDLALDKDYDGIIITHGSDTLAYTSAFLAMYYSWIDIPVAIVAANYPLEDERSNGMSNFAGAVGFIKEKVASGVFTVYRNHNNEVDVFLPSRMLSSDPYFDQYPSFDGEVFGKMEGGRFIWNEKCPVTIDMVKQHPKNKERRMHFHYENEVLAIQTYLGINFRNYQLTEKTKAVFISLYHSATGPITEVSGMYSFIESCEKAGVHVYGASLKSEDMCHYQTTDAMLKKGMRPMYNISGVAAYAKLVLAYNQNEVKPEEIIKRNLFFEILELFRK